MTYLSHTSSTQLLLNSFAFFSTNNGDRISKKLTESDNLLKFLIWVIFIREHS